MSHIEVISSLSKEDMIEITYTSMELYNAGSKQTHTGQVVDIIPDESDESSSSHQVVYKITGGEVFLFDGQDDRIYVYETEEHRTVKGTNATISVLED